jgi:hypothetical protein
VICVGKMNENNVNKLLEVFLELDRAAEREQQTELFSEVVREHRQIGPEGQTGTK